ncbi:MAG: M20 family metallopeptidase [Chloroflexota bacterium]|nr:M20 family metallopeptidase [Chloroflexota bacterium]
MISDAELERLRATVAGWEKDFLRDLEWLVNVDCGSYTKVGVDEVGAWMGERLAELGAKVRVQHDVELGDTVVGSFPVTGKGPRVLLVGHLDTVFPAGTVAERPFHISDGRAYGPGVTDMKAGLLAGLYALRALAALGALPFGRLVYIANPDEEIGSPRSGRVIRGEAEQSDVGLVLECARANGDIVSARKGVVDYRIRLHGRAAHAGVEPERGRSAVVEAAHKTIALTALNDRWPGVTVNVGVVNGGTRPNVVAQEAQMQVDLRAATRATLEAAEAELHAICATSTVPDVVTEVEARARHWPMEKSVATAQLASGAIELAGRLGFALSDAATGGASDANTIAGLGVPTLDGLGPVGGADHSPDEYLELDSIVPRTTLLAALLLSIGRDDRLAAAR